MKMILLIVVVSIILSCILFILIGIYITIQKLRKRKEIEKIQDPRLSIGILHPFLCHGRDEEKILWGIVQAIHEMYPHCRIIVFTGDIDSPPERILSRAKLLHGLTVSPSIVEFIYIRRRRLIDPELYPRFPRFGINLGSIGVCLEAIWKFIPDIYLDTMGYPLTFPIWKYLGGCRIGSYLSNLSPEVLYSSRFENHHMGRNKYTTLFQEFTNTKLYRFIFSLAAQTADIILVNSSWTECLVNEIWASIQTPIICLHPPCPIDLIRDQIVPRESSNGDNSSILQIISLASFTSNSDHPLQIRVLFQLRQLLTEEEWDRIQLVCVGPCITPQEITRVKDMEDLSKHLSVEDNVSFRLNLSSEEIISEIQESLIALHTTGSDSFNIGLVMCMAGGAICVAHNSGGTSKDITIDCMGRRNAFLASDEVEYAEAIRHIIHMKGSARLLIRNHAEAAVDRFSETQFHKHFLEAMEFLLK